MNNVIAFDRSKKKETKKPDATAYGFLLDHRNDSVCVVLDRSNCKISYFEDGVDKNFRLLPLEDFIYKDVVCVVEDDSSDEDPEPRFIVIQVLHKSHTLPHHVFAILDLGTGIPYIIPVPKVKDYIISSMEILSSTKDESNLKAVDFAINFVFDISTGGSTNTSMITTYTTVELYSTIMTLPF